VTQVPLKAALAAATAGGILGSLARAGLTDRFDAGSGFPWTVFAINVLGSALLAGVPALPAVRRTPWVGVFLGTGVMGGFTTMSAASTQSVTLFEHHRTGTAIAYVTGTLLAAVVAVWLVERFTTPTERAAADAAGVDS
jgi:CrcB protein